MTLHSPKAYAYQVEATVRNNIGDVLQGLAAKAFLPSGAIVADRENLQELQGQADIFLIANGWYMHDVSKFTPPDNVVPFYISVHIAKSALLHERGVREHLLRHAPIGARDRKTLQLLRAWNIPAYYSGCLTITTQRRPSTPPENPSVLLVDNVDHPLPESIINVLRAKYGTVEMISHDPPSAPSGTQEYATASEQRMETLLKRYCSAAHVITTKIHCALPCLGMGVNVLLIHPDPNDPRLDTVREFLPIVSYEQILTKGLPDKVAPDLERLRRRKSFLERLVRGAVLHTINPVRHPKTLDLRILKLTSILASYGYSLAFRLAYRLGWNRIQLGKVFAK